MKIIDNLSPNYDKKKRSINLIKIIVFHYTGMQSERESINRLCNANSKVSSHYFINSKGKIFRLVKEQNIAWHAGKSCWLRFKNLNSNSIGIEIVNKGHRFGYTNFKEKQIASLIRLCKKLKKKYKIKSNNFVGHSDIAPLRKKDPGEKFPWKFLADNKIGIWHDYKFALLKKLRKKIILKKQEKKDFFNYLNKIGYCVQNKKKQTNAKVIRAFQMRFRRELINGVLDKECLIIAKNLAKKL